MAFEAHELTLDLIGLLHPVLTKLRRHDVSLTKQLTTAAASIALNLAEGAERKGGDRKHLFAIASGSAAEVRSILRVALAFRHVTSADIAVPLEYVDRIKAMTYRLKT